MFHLLSQIIIIVVTMTMIYIQKAHAGDGKLVENSHIQIAPFYWMIIIVGGLNLLTLIYVGWKKYKAEKESARKKESNY